MRKIALYAVCIALATPLLAQSPQDTVAKVLQAMGGPAAISKWRDLDAEGEFKFSFGGNEFVGKIRIVRKGPQSWSKTTLKFGSETFVVITAFDGKAAWTDRQGTVSDEPTVNNETELRHDLDLLLHGDVTWTLGTESELEGGKVSALEAERQGKKTTFWIDPITYQVREISYKDTVISEKAIKEEKEIRVRLADYKSIDGTTFATKVTNYRDGRKGSEVTLSKVTFGPSISPSFFQRPQQKVDLRYEEERID
jgi:hypothetical protein